MDRVAAHVCTHCPWQLSCRAKGRNGTTKRGIHRNIHQTLFTSVAARMQTPTFCTKLAERMWKVEGLISEAKQLHGLTKARYRGLSKTQIQVYLIASVLNIKRLAFFYFYWWQLLSSLTALILKLVKNLNASSSLLHHPFSKAPVVYLAPRSDC